MAILIRSVQEVLEIQDCQKFKSLFMKIGAGSPIFQQMTHRLACTLHLFFGLVSLKLLKTASGSHRGSGETVPDPD